MCPAQRFARPVGAVEVDPDVDGCGSRSAIPAGPPMSVPAPSYCSRCTGDSTNVTASPRSRLSALPAAALRLRCVSVLGAAETLATELNLGATSAEEAVSALTDPIVGSIGAGKRP